MLECTGLQKWYGERAAVGGVDLHICEGRVFGLLGPNGAGKSTLLKMITGLVWPDAGEARIRGFDVHRQRMQALNRVGAVIEWPAFYPYLSARENIRLITGHRSKAFNERLERAATLVGMEHWLDKQVATFSTGMKQRVGIALACLPDSEFIILDEPANGLDPGGMVELRQILRDLNKEHGATVLVSSHLLGEIEQVCDEVAIMHCGEMAACGTVEALTGKGGNLFIGAEPGDQVVRILHEASFTHELRADGLYKIEAPEDAAAGLNAALIAAGCRVWRLAYERWRLEDAFLRITGGAGDVE